MIRIVPPTVQLLTSEEEILQFPSQIEESGRTCYRSEDRMGANTDEAFCRMLIRRGHESVLEHCQLRARFRCDRATSHQLVRHRLCAFSQESQRFVAYRDQLDVIEPPFEQPRARELWKVYTEEAIRAYHTMLEYGERPENARSLLPNCTATRIVMSANVRQWRHVFQERAINPRAQQQIRSLMMELLQQLAELVPCLFEDLLLKQ